MRKKHNQEYPPENIPFCFIYAVGDFIKASIVLPFKLAWGVADNFFKLK